MSTSSQPNYAAVRGIIDDAEPVATIHAFKGDPEPGKPRDGVLPGQWRPDALGLPPDCPVTPLGVDGRVSWYLDPIGQLCPYTKPYGQAETLDLFRGRHLYLYWAWPKHSAKTDDEGHAIVDGWRNERAREALIAAAAAKGLWRGIDKLRGRGCWRAPGGSLVVHCGHKIVLSSSGRLEPPGEIDGFVYQALPPLPRPSPRPVEQAQNPAKLLRPLFESWNWARPKIDAHLLLGWIGAAFLGGALDHRPVCYITGDKGTGKSTLQQIIKGLFGEWLVQAVNTSAAGIYQHVGHDSVAVSVDEFEGGANNSKATAVIELARQAYSGGLMLRGGSEHHGVQFQARSAFIFSSINTPPLRPQDRSRMALLKLYRLLPGSVEPDARPEVYAPIGRAILRRLIDQWHRFEETLEAFRAEVKRSGLDSRGADTIGTLLACADMVEFDGWSEDRLSAPNEDGDVRPWAEMIKAAGMVEANEDEENWRACLDHMLQAPVDAWRNGNRPTVGRLLADWIKSPDDFGHDWKNVDSALGQAGLGLRRDVGPSDWLIVPNNSPLLKRLMDGSIWGGDYGAGVWADALRQGPRDEVWKLGQARVNGVKSKCTLISLDALYGRNGIMTDPPDLPDQFTLSG